MSPVGSHEKKRFYGRVIATTNRTLRELRGGGLFRDDFFYRLCSDVIIVPPLRQHLAQDPGELETLVRHMVRRTLGEDEPKMVAMVRETIDKQLGIDYPWPGNVRELEQCVRRIFLKRHYGGNQETMSSDLLGTLVQRLESGTLDAAGVLEGYCTLLYQRHRSYEQVARLTRLDRRTVRKYVRRWVESQGSEGDGGSEEKEPD